MVKPRIYSLDAVRGVSALLIVFYHVSFWKHRSLEDGGTYFTQKLGFYMVELFYLLSGVSMGYVYLEKFSTISVKELKSFFLKRYFRIAPLYILLCIASIWIYNRVIDTALLIRVLANFSLLFGVVEPGYSLLTGGWSIGVEFFFYLFFPFFLFLVKRSWFWDVLILLVLLGSVIFIAIEIKSSYSTLPKGWKWYSYPMNHFLYFWMGVLISRLRNIKAHWLYLLMGVLLFLFSGFLTHAVADYSVGLVTGLNRLLLSVSVVLIVLYFYLKVKFRAEWLNHVSDWLASISFSLYLLHPIVYFLLGKFLNAQKISLSFWPTFLLVLSITVLISRVMFFYEKYFMNWGNKLVGNIKK